MVSAKEEAYDMKRNKIIIEEDSEISEEDFSQRWLNSNLKTAQHTTSYSEIRIEVLNSPITKSDFSQRRKVEKQKSRKVEK